MTRSGKYTKPPVSSDLKYPKVPSISKLINCLMFDGKKSISRRLVHGAIERICAEKESNPQTLLDEVIALVKPTCFIRFKKIASKRYMIPVPITEHKAISMGVKWIKVAMSVRVERGGENRLYAEIVAIMRGEGSEALKLRAQYLKNARDNEIYAHYI